MNTGFSLLSSSHVNCFCLSLAKHNLKAEGKEAGVVCQVKHSVRRSGVFNESDSKEIFGVKGESLHISQYRFKARVRQVRHLGCKT